MFRKMRRHGQQLDQKTCEKILDASAITAMMSAHMTKSSPKATQYAFAPKKTRDHEKFIASCSRYSTSATVRIVRWPSSAGTNENKR